MSKKPKSYTGTAKIEQARKTAFIQKIRAGKPTKTIYEVGAYDRTNKGYEVTNIEDINRFSYLKKGTIVKIVSNY